MKAQLLDTREPGDFAAAHVARSINIDLGGQYATWAGTVLSRERPIVIIADPGRENEAAVRLGRIGFDQVLGGWLAQPRIAARPDGDHRTRQRTGGPERLAQNEPPLAVDVRAPRERARNYIAGTVSLPLNHLTERLHELPQNRLLLMYCAGGYRSSVAASLLHGHGSRM